MRVWVWPLLSLWLWGCTPGQTPDPAAPCNAEQPTSGVIVSELDCRERIPMRGAAVTADTWMASPFLRAVVRHPQNARTLPAVGGGTLVDVATWTDDDVAYEWAPLVGGGWLSVSHIEREFDGVVLTGEVRSLPDRDVPEGATHSVRWRLDPVAPVIHLEGADGLWMHPLPGTQPLGPGFVTRDTQVVTDGVVVEDLGGAVRLAGVARIAVAPLGTDAWLDHPVVPLNVHADGPTLAIDTGADIVRVNTPVVDDAVLPAPVERVRAERVGHAASAWVSPDDAVQVGPGQAGSVDVVLRNAAFPTVVRWVHEDGRTGRDVAHDGRVTLDVGAGTVTVGIFDVRVREDSVTIEVSATRVRSVVLQVETRFDVSHHVPVAFRWPGGRDRGLLVSDGARLTDALANGVPFVVLTPRDDIADADIDALIRLRNGTTLTSVDGWSITAWPWNAHPRRGAHGAPSVRSRTPIEALALAREGPSPGRFLLVDTAWLAQVEPGPVDPLPSGVYLDRIADLAVWYEWLNAGIALPPTGPLTWVEVPVPSNVMAVEAERMLVRHDTVASTEGRIDFEVGTARPGDRVERPVFTEGVATVHTAGALTAMDLVVDGAVVQTWPVLSGRAQAVRVPPSARWALVVARGVEDFAVTGPIWFGPAPTDGVPDAAGR